VRHSFKGSPCSLAGKGLGFSAWWISHRGYGAVRADDALTWLPVRSSCTTCDAWCSFAIEQHSLSVVHPALISDAPRHTTESVATSSADDVCGRVTTAPGPMAHSRQHCPSTSTRFCFQRLNHYLTTSSTMKATLDIDRTKKKSIWSNPRTLAAMFLGCGPWQSTPLVGTGPLSQFLSLIRRARSHCVR
jgi:hypothetical protein